MPTLYETLGLEAPAAPDKDSPLVTRLASSLDEAINLPSGEAFAKAIVDSPEYRRSIVRRILFDELPPAVECRILDHAYGQPVKRLEVKDKTNEFENFTPEQLEARASVLLNYARSLRRTNDEVPQSSPNAEEDVASSIVH